MNKNQANALLEEEQLSVTCLQCSSKEEGVSYYPSIGLLEYHKRQITTAAENRLKSALIAALEQSGFSGELAHQEILVIPLRQARRSSAIKKALENLPHQYKTARFTLRRPDFLSFKYGFVIEVDGSAHWQMPKRILRDQTRYAEYKVLGLDTFVIEHDWIFDPPRLHQFIESIVSHIGNQNSRLTFKQEYQARRTTISRARKSFVQSCGNSTKIGHFTRKNPKKLHYPTCRQPGTFQYGGIRYPFGEPQP